METRNDTILRYADRIYSFAYGKTKNHHQAQDLAQEILVQLCGGRTDFTAIGNMDAYIYRICRYTWSNYLRKNKPMWQALENADVLDVLASEENVEEDFLERELFEQLRQEVMYLGRIRRQITVMYYYENRTGDEIAEILGIPPSTVRWHMRKTRDTLKERMEMKTQNEIYTPVRLDVGHSGWAEDYNMHGMRTDVLTQNIVWVCREKALTVEEIARTLGCAAVYLENKIDELTDMDYMRKVGANRYITNFMIENVQYVLKTGGWQYKYAYPTARAVCGMLRERLPQIKKSDVMDGEFSDDFLLAALLVPELNRAGALLSHFIRQRAGLSFPCVTPKRSDGSEHWVCAWNQSSVTDEAMTGYDADYLDFMRYSSLTYKDREAGGLHSQQCDHRLFGGWRDFENTELKQLARVRELIEKEETPNDYDMDGIVNLREKGYIRIDGGRPVILIPCLRKNGNGSADTGDVIGRYEKLFAENLNMDEVCADCLKEIELRKRLIPAHLDDNQRNAILGGSTNIHPSAMFYTLYQNGDLAMPTEDEQKRILTLVWEV
ncbi:MAG: sigma-70 family RNA polymerase sigma factor [Clostridia bacterium]|nr:sigma-70 family RNA polymerase sigma factor [Clostridia bacterium]